MYSVGEIVNNYAISWVFACLLQRYGSAVSCCRGRGPGCSKPGYGISLLGGGCHKHHRRTCTYKGLGKQTLGGNKQKLCAPGPRKKAQWPHKRLTQTCLWVSRSLQWRCGLAEAWCRVGGTEFSSASMDLLKKVFSNNLSMFLTNSSSINSCNFGVLVGGGMLRVFLLCYLGYSENFFFVCVWCISFSILLFSLDKHQLSANWASLQVL